MFHVVHAAATVFFPHCQLFCPLPAPSTPLAAPAEAALPAPYLAPCPPPALRTLDLSSTPSGVRAVPGLSGRRAFPWLGLWICRGEVGTRNFPAILSPFRNFST